MTITRLQEVQQILPVLLAAKELSLDTETTGFTESDRLFSLIISTEEEDYYLNFNDYGGAYETLPKEEVFGLLKPVFSDPDKLWYLQNAKFDMHMLAKEGAQILGVIFCCATILRVLRNNLMDRNKPYSLEAQAARNGWAKDDGAKKAIKELGLVTKVRVPGKLKVVELQHYDRIPAEIMFKYGSQDGNVTFKLGRKYAKELRETPSLTRVAMNEMELTKTCFSVERTGILMDPVYTRNAWAYDERLILEAKQSFHDQFSTQYPSTPAKVKEFFQKLGYVLPKTKKGNDSVDADALEMIEHPAARLIEKTREHEKRITTYYSSFLWNRDVRNIIRADMVQYGTETGRFSYRSPNLQNLPKEDDVSDLLKPFQVRGCFVPRPNRVFVAVDFAQQEYRMMLDYAGEQKLIDLVMSGMDLHQATADMVGITRKQAKTLNFAILYGAGPAKLAVMLGISIMEAQHLMDKYFSRLPRVQQLIWKVINKGKSQGYITNWMGRRCHISSPQWAYVLPNHLIQGGCADVIKVAMNRIQRGVIEARNLDMRMLLNVHDELLFELPMNEVEHMSEITKIMESVYTPMCGMQLLTDTTHSFKSYSYKDKVKGLPQHEVA